MKRETPPNPGELTPREKEILRPTLDAIDAGAPVLEIDPDVVRLRDLIVAILEDRLHVVVVTAAGQSIEVYTRGLLGPEPDVKDLIPLAAALDVARAEDELECFGLPAHENT